MMFRRGYNVFENRFGNCFDFGSGFMHNGWGMIIAGVVLLIAVIVAVYFIVKASKRSRPGSDEALDLLKMRFIKGEISEEEYLRMKNMLTK
ncbi:MAG: SHOCT domain-containing protein [Saccharofermentanales bacterium]